MRRLRFTGPEIAELLSMVSGILTRIGMGKLGRVGLEPARRYECERPGELVHVDVKKLGRIQGGAGNRVRGGFGPLTTLNSPTAPTGAATRSAGSSSTSRLMTARGSPYAGVPCDEKATTAIAFLRLARAFFERHGITVERLLTDNGSAYRSTVHAIACRALGIRHQRTRPYRQQTNGKACVLGSGCRPVGRRGCPRPAV